MISLPSFSSLFPYTTCLRSGTLTLGEAGNYVINNGHSAIAGSTTPIIDTGAAIANVNLSMPDWHNGVEIRNLNATGTDLFSISGIGQIVYSASSTGTVNQRGRFKVTNTGGVTITYDDPSQNEIDTLADTNELQTNQGNWLTATGFATETKQDIIDTNVDAILIDTGTTLPTLIGSPVADIATDIAGVQTDTTAIVADTNELQTDWTNGGRLDLLLDRLITELDTARAEPGQGTPAASTKIGDKIDYLYKNWRNLKEETATTFSLYNDAGSVVDQKATVADDGTTASKTEIVTGP